MRRPIHPLPSCLLCSGLKKKSPSVTKENKGTIKQCEQSLCAGHITDFHHCSPLLCYLLISLIYILPSEQSSSTGDQFKYWKFPLQCSSELEHVVKH